MIVYRSITKIIIQWDNQYRYNIVNIKLPYQYTHKRTEILAVEHEVVFLKQWSTKYLSRIRSSDMRDQLARQSRDNIFKLLQLFLEVQ